MKNWMIVIGLVIIIIFTGFNSIYAQDMLDNISSIGDNLTEDALKVTEDEIISKENASEVLNKSNQELIIMDENYDQYFNKFTGKFREDVDVSDVGILKLGNLSNKLFVFEKKIRIIPLTSDSQIRNGVIHLMSGSDGSIISEITINNTLGDIYQDGLFISRLHGIWISNSSNNIISNNNIFISKQYGCYAMPMDLANNNKIMFNNIYSGLTSCIVMGRSHYNNISYNHIEITGYEDMTSSNLIYFNPWGHADSPGGVCIGNYISNNYLKNYGNGMWSYTIAIEMESNDTKIINNTIVNGGVGIYVSDLLHSQANNILIQDNTIINCSSSIFTGNNDVTITYNVIQGTSMGTGIVIDGTGQDELKYIPILTISNNHINYEDLSNAILCTSNNAEIYDNIINLTRYGVGINIQEAINCTVRNNIVNVVGDDAIVVFGINTTISNNIISTKIHGVSIRNYYDKIKLYNNNITSNIIYSDNYGIYIEGQVYNTLIQYNEIETNQSEGIYFNPKESYTDLVGDVLDNSVNGVIEDTQTIIVNDDNFYDYFTQDGYLNFEFEENSRKIIFFTFLSNKDIYFTDQITLTSNKMSNLLYNVSIYLKNDASSSSIKDLKFYNIDKAAITLDNVDEVLIKNNEFTLFSTELFDIKAISIIGGENCNITENDIFISSKAKYTYAIYLSNPINSIVNYFSKDFLISENNIIVKSSGVGEGIYADSLVESEIVKNNINIASDGSAYGISVCNVIGRPHDIKINSNEILIYSKEMSYLIEIYMVDSCEIINNYLSATSNGVYGIGVYNSNDLFIQDNEIIIHSNPLTNSTPSDALGKGNASIYITRTSTLNSFFNNTMDVENANTIIKDSSSIINKFYSNNYVLADYNHELYFDLNNTLIRGILKDNDAVLFKNFTSLKTMEINIPVIILPYKYLNQFCADLILSDGANNSSISQFDFINATITLDNSNDVNIYNNTFLSSFINVIDGFRNNISNNTFNESKIVFKNTNDALFDNNSVLTNSSFILIDNSLNTTITNNWINASGNSFVIITSNSSINNTIGENIFNVTSLEDIIVYKAINTTQDKFLNNIIDSIGVSNTAVIYYDLNSSKNQIMYNRITSHTSNGRDYAVVIDTTRYSYNTVANNYLIASNGYRRGNDAVNAPYELVCNNTPVDIYVSVNGSVNANGSFENPYSTIHEAIENALSGAIVYILPGYYNEINLSINKNITLTAFNQEGNTYIDALGGQLFNITRGGSLTVNALKILNGFSVIGGSLFYNLGELIINNSMIYNSSSYYDNSNPEFSPDKFTNTVSHSFNCENLGLGGAILNYGTLTIESSDLFDNFAHKGGAIADFGKVTIKNSLIYNNTAVHGGAVFTDSTLGFNIENSEFRDNLAIQTLDYCYIKRTTLDSTVKYSFHTECDEPIGHGGAIYSNSIINITDSLFEHNIARAGGAIAHYSDIDIYYGIDGPDYNNFGLKSKYISRAKLNINNSTFRYNEAKDTRCGNISMFEEQRYSYYYTSNYNGGAILGTIAELNIQDSLFEYNYANSNGGALCVQCKNSTIVGSKFYNNTAGAYGGALDGFGDINVLDTEIINNHAERGGALTYSSYTSYGHVQNNMVMFNVTVSGNNALDEGGAFVISNSNFAITNSNIYDNNAPYHSTFFVKASKSDIDARSNWWGSFAGPDDSVWSYDQIKFRTWLSQRVDWEIMNVNNPISGGDENNGGGNGISHSPSSISTGLGTHTGSTLQKDLKYSGNNGAGFSFSGNLPYSNGGSKLLGFGNLNFAGNNSGSSRTQVSGNAKNTNSLSKVNSSNILDLPSIGLTSNAADSSQSSSSSNSNGENDGASSNQVAYEITPDVKKEINDSDLSIFNILFILLWILFFIGFYMRFKSEDDI